jgi:hypothetical protein
MGDRVEFTATARRFGIFSGSATVILLVAYAVTLIVGLASLGSPQEPIGDPMFTILEILIITMMPAMVALMVAVHSWAPMHAKTLSLTSLIFMSLLAGVTCSLHFCILTLSRQPEFAGQSWLPLVFSFEWPSVAYALDIVGCLLCALDVVRCPGLFGEPPGRMDPRADDCQRGALARRLERGGCRRHGSAKHRHSRLRWCVPRGGGAADCLLLQSESEVGHDFGNLPPLYSPNILEGKFSEVAPSMNLSLQWARTLRWGT